MNVTNNKHTTIGMYIMHVAAILGLVLTWAFQNGGVIHDAIGVDITKWIALAWAISFGLYTIGKGIETVPLGWPTTPVVTPPPPVVSPVSITPATTAAVVPVPTVPVPSPSISSVPTPPPISDPTVEIPVGTPGAGTPTAPGPADALDGTSLLTTPHL